MSKVKRVPPVLPSVPTRPSSSPSTIMATALITEPCASTTAATRPSTISEKYSGAPNDWPTLASGGAKHRDQRGRDAAGEERAERRDRERRAGAALARHLVAVDAGHHRRGLARQVDQDRGGRAAVLRAVEDAGEHDQAGHRLEMEGERQQHRDGGDRADAGQHADQRADHGADEGEAEIGRRQRDPEADGEIVRKIPSRYQSGQTGIGQPQPDDEDRPATARSAPPRRSRSRAAAGSRVASAPMPVSSRMATTRPSRSMLRPKATRLARDQDHRAPRLRRRRSGARRAARKPCARTTTPRPSSIQHSSRGT